VRIDDEHNLSERLDSAIETITPRPAPVDRAVRRGKTIRVRRRVAAAVGAAAGVAAIVAIGVITVPSLDHGASPAPAPASGHYTVTVQPPGSHSPAGLIASGTVNGKAWRIGVDQPGTHGAGRGRQDVYASGPAFTYASGSAGGTSALSGTGPALRADTDPVAFDGGGSAPTTSLYGAVRADVSYVKVTLGNGTVVTLRPVTVYGVRAVGLAYPANAVIDAVTAYSRHGEIATAIPFDGPDATPYFGIWLKPGQHGSARASGQIGSGTVLGTAWSSAAYLGPWGVCIVDTGTEVGGSVCAPGVAHLGTAILNTEGDDAPGVDVGVTSPSVVRIVVHRADGSTIQARPVTIGDQKFFAFTTVKGPGKFSWAAYDALGDVVKSSAG
jgi:hypothetical protein